MNGFPTVLSVLSSQHDLRCTRNYKWLPYSNAHFSSLFFLYQTRKTVGKPFIIPCPWLSFACPNKIFQGSYKCVLHRFCTFSLLKMCRGEKDRPPSKVRDIYCCLNSFKAFSILKRIEALQTKLESGYTLKLHKLSVSSNGSRPFKQIMSWSVSTSLVIFQYPQTDRGPSNHRTLWRCRTYCGLSVSSNGSRPFKPRSSRGDQKRYQLSVSSNGSRPFKPADGYSYTHARLLSVSSKGSTAFKLLARSRRPSPSNPFQYPQRDRRPSNKLTVMDKLNRMAAFSILKRIDGLQTLCKSVNYR
jgi:hypothetical protein